jgi:hypothetical protein
MTVLMQSISNLHNPNAVCGSDHAIRSVGIGDEITLGRVCGDMLSHVSHHPDVFIQQDSKLFVRKTIDVNHRNLATSGRWSPYLLEHGFKFIFDCHTMRLFDHVRKVRMLLIRQLHISKNYSQQKAFQRI